MSRIAGLLTVVLLAALPVAATENPLAPLDTSSPFATFQAFTREAAKVEQAYAAYLRDRSVATATELLRRSGPVRSLFDVSAVPPATRYKTAGESAGLLIDILDRLPQVEADRIPGAPGHPSPDLPGQWTVPGTEIRIARIGQGPRAGEYLFSQDTVARLPDFHALIIGQPQLRPALYRSWREQQVRLTGPFFLMQYGEHLPEPLQRTLLGTPVWKVAAAVAVALGIIAATVFWTVRVQRVAARFSTRPLRRRLLQVSSPALLAALVAAEHFFNVTQINLSGQFATIETIVETLLLYASAAWAAWIVCFLVVEFVIASPSFPEDSYDAHLLRLLARVGSPLVAAAILAYGANDIGLPALGVVAGLGVGGIALALAAQSTIENLFGGIAIFADRPFRVGDAIRYGSNAGTVEAIGPRSTRIRGEDGTLITVPNGDLAKAQISNVAMRDRCVFRHRINLGRKVPADQLVRILAATRAILGAHPRIAREAGQPRANLVGLAPTIEIEVSANVLTRDWGEFLAVQEELIQAIMHAIRTRGAPEARAPGVLADGVRPTASGRRRQADGAWQFGRACTWHSRKRTSFA